MQDDDEDELLRKAKAGDEQALDQLLGRLRSYLKAIAQQKLHPRLHVRKDPSDLVQETLEQGFRDFGRFVGATPNELKAYLRRILERNAIDTLRAEFDALRRSVRAECSLDAPEAGAKIMASLAAEDTTPSQQAVRSELMDLVLSAMEQLPEAQRKAFGLWLRHYTFREIAEELDRTESAAQSLVKHARKRILEQLPQELRTDSFFEDSDEE